MTIQEGNYYCKGCNSILNGDRIHTEYCEEAERYIVLEPCSQLVAELFQLLKNTQKDN